MRWAFALKAEVIGRAHEAVAEEHLPEVIHSDTGGERIVAGDQPFGEIKTGGCLLLGPSQHGGQHSSLDLVTFLVPHATDEDVRFASFLAFLQNHHVDFLLGCFHFTKSLLGAIDDRLSVNVRFVIGKELLKEPRPELRFHVFNPADLRACQHFQRWRIEAASCLSSLICQGNAEAADGLLPFE